MQVSHETIYRALYVQARGSLRRELARHLSMKEGGLASVRRRG
jgi:IS30 family transposase